MRAQARLQRTINRILLLLDHDPEQRREALQFALGLGRLCRASLLMVCPVDEPPPIFQGSPIQVPTAMLMANALEDEKAKAQEMVDDSLAQCRRSGVRAEGAVVLRAREALQAKGTKWGGRCDLVVVSRQGRHGLERIFETDVAVEVVKSAACPVLVVERRRGGVRKGRTAT